MIVIARRAIAVVATVVLTIATPTAVVTVVVIVVALALPDRFIGEIGRAIDHIAASIFELVDDLAAVADRQLAGPEQIELAIGAEQDAAVAIGVGEADGGPDLVVLAEVGDPVEPGRGAIVEEEDVLVAPAAELIVARAADQRVFAALAEQPVVASPAVERVVVATAVQQVIARSGAQRVVTAIATQGLVGAAAEQIIVAASADQIRIVDEHRHQLTLLDRRRIARRGMDLRIDQIRACVAIAEQVGDVDHARAFLVARDEARGARGKQRGVEIGDLRERVAGDVILPDLGDIVLPAGIFLQRDLAVGDADVVEHLLAFGAVEHGLDGTAEQRIGDVDERRLVQPRRLPEAIGGDEVQHIGVVGVPRRVFGAKESGHALGHAFGLERGAGKVADVAAGPHFLEREAAIGDRAIRFDRDPGDLDPVQFAIGQPGLVDLAARRLLVADVYVDLAAGDVVGGGDDRLVLRERIGDGIFVGNVAEVGEFVGDARARTRHDGGEGAALGAGFLAGEIDPRLRAKSARGIE